MATIAINFAIGFGLSFIGSLLTPRQTIEGPRLDDLGGPKFSYGEDVVRIWGAARVPLKVVWTTQFEEVRQTSGGGKGGFGGPRNVRFIYFGTFAGIYTRGPAIGIRKLWFTGRPVFNMGPDADQETIDNSTTFANAHLETYLGTLDQPVSPTIEGVDGVGNVPAYRDRTVQVIERLPLEDYGNTFPIVSGEVVQAGSVDGNGIITADLVPLSTVIVEACSEVGITPDLIDVSALTKMVRGAILQTGTVGEALRQIARAYQVDVIESEGKLKFLEHPRSPVAAPPLADFAAYENGQERPPNDFEETIVAETELPTELVVSAFDPALAYSRNVQSSSRHTSRHQNTVRVDLPVVLFGSEILTLADQELYRQWTQRYRYEFTLMPRWAVLEAGDVITVPFRDGFEVLLTRVQVGANLLVRCEAVRYESSIFEHQAQLFPESTEVVQASLGSATSPPKNTYVLERSPIQAIVSVTNASGTVTYAPNDDWGVDLNAGEVIRNESGAIPENEALRITYSHFEEERPAQVRMSIGTDLRILDTNMIRDTDVELGLYAVGAGDSSWRGASLYASRDNTNYQFVQELTATSAVGTATTALTASPNPADTLTVQLDLGSLQSISAADLAAGGNTALVGDELIRFQTAVLQPDGTYLLSDISRGVRGTDHNIVGHAIDENFSLFNSAVIRIEGVESDIGETLYFKAPTDEETLDDAPVLAFVVIGNSVKPYGPANVTAVHDAGVTENWTIDGDRRDRLAGDATNLSNIPLSEPSEQYELDILDGQTVTRTIQSGSLPITYTEAQQITDFGVVQTSLSGNLYQIGRYGRGHPAEVSG